MPANESFDKGAAIEEWADTHFFRPVGVRIARACYPTRITPDHVTLMALVVGLVAGRLCFYNDAALNALGVALFIVSDFFDSADGQLARMRGTSTRFGRIVDGLSDGARFINLYLQLIARLLVAGEAWWLVVPLGVLAGIAHARQSGTVDHIRQLYKELAESGSGELALPEDLESLTGSSIVRRLQSAFFRRYVAGYTRSLPNSVAMVRRLRAERTPDRVAVEWRTLQLPVVRQCAWIAQNVRFLLIAVTIVPGYPAAFLWITLVPMTGIMLLIRFVHERNAAALLEQQSSGLTAATAT